MITNVRAANEAGRCRCHLLDRLNIAQITLEVCADTLLSLGEKRAVTIKNPQDTPSTTTPDTW